MGGVAGVWQSSWFACSKCALLFRVEADFLPFTAAPSATAGVCPAGGPHDAQANPQLAVMVGDSDPAAQGGWRRCQKCGVLFFGASGSGGTCPADGQAHEGDGGDHLLAAFDTPDPALQSGWNWCLNCAGMFAGQSAAVCPATHGAHQAPSPLVMRHVQRFAILFDHSSLLPHGRAWTPSATVDLKINTETCIGWWALCTGAWSDEVQSPWQLHFVGESSDDIAAARLGLQMSPRGGCVITALVLNLTPNVQSQLQGHFGREADLMRALALGVLASPTPVACTNFYAGAFDDCEYGGGENNNGIGATLTAGPATVQLWPKREDRLRLDLILPNLAAVDIEFDTHE